MTDPRPQLEAALLEAANALLQHMNTSAVALSGEGFSVYAGLPDAVASLLPRDPPTEVPDA